MTTPVAVLFRAGLVLALAASAGAAESVTTADVAGWRSIWNGKDLTGWDTYMVNPPDKAWDVPGLKRDDLGNYTEGIGKNRDPLKVFTLEVADGHPQIHVSGQGFGVMMTTEVFRDFRLRVEVKWGEKKWSKKAALPRDAGLLYFCFDEPPAVDRTWPRGIEFQIQEHDIGDLFALGTQITVPARTGPGPAGRAPLHYYDPLGEPTDFKQVPPVGNRCIKLVDAEKPNGEWNQLELVCLGGDSIHIVNGKVVMRLHRAQKIAGPGAPGPLTEGKIALQTEGAEVYYRDVQVRPITAIPAEYAEPAAPTAPAPAAAPAAK